jgi:PAS domain S-box-containing protein
VREATGDEAAASGATSAVTRAPELGAVIVAALDEIPVGVSVTSIVDGAPVRLYANRALAQMIGTSLEELLASPPIMTVAPEERQRMAAVARAWGEGKATIVETVILTQDGRRLPVEVRVGGTVVDGLPITISLLTDLSARLAIEAALRESEARFRQLAEAAPDTITVVSGGRFVYVNPAAVRVFGFDSADELMARPLDDLLYADEARVMMERIRGHAAGVALTPREYVGRRKDGGKAILEISAIAIMYRGEPAVLAFGRDVSERKRMQAELMRADRMAMIGTLATGVAHEVNNPLTYVLVHLRRLRALLPAMIPQAGDRARVEQLVSEALDGSERVARIVRDLLSFARPGGDEGQAVEVAGVLDSVILLARSSLEQRVRVERRYEVVPPAHADAARLAQVFLNLVLNAVQAFSADAPARNQIVASVRGDRSWIEIEIADNGPGIAGQDLQRVFDPFFTTKPPGSGTGLGLTISRAIVEAFGGELTLRSEEGSGARAIVRLRAWPYPRAG